MDARWAREARRVFADAGEKRLEAGRTLRECELSEAQALLALVNVAAWACLGALTALRRPRKACLGPFAGTRSHRSPLMSMRKQERGRDMTLIDSLPLMAGI